MSQSFITMRVLGSGSQPPKADPTTSLADGLLAQNLAKQGKSDNPDAWMASITVVYCVRENCSGGGCSSAGEWTYYVYAGAEKRTGDLLSKWCADNNANYGFLKAQIDEVVASQDSDYLCVWCVPMFSPNTAIYRASGGCSGSDVHVFKLTAGAGGERALCLRVGRRYDSAALDPPPAKARAEYLIEVTVTVVHGGNLWRKWWERPTAVGAPEGIILDAGESAFQANGHPWSDTPELSRVRAQTCSGEADMLAMEYLRTEGKLRVGATFDEGSASISGLALHEGGANVDPTALSAVDFALTYDLPNAYAPGAELVRPGLYHESEEGVDYVVLSSSTSAVFWHRTDEIQADTPSGTGKEPNARATVPEVDASYSTVQTAAGDIVRLYGNENEAARYSSYLEAVTTFEYTVKITLMTNNSGDTSWDKSNWEEAHDITVNCGYTSVVIPWQSFGCTVNDEGYYEPYQDGSVTLERGDAEADYPISATNELPVSIDGAGGKSIAIYHVGDSLPAFADFKYAYNGYTADKEVSPL